ncbi:hypothetical protein [Halodurantibacterium flavum]|uniref:Uncharacterized protein n=1 Tax=Halodurantibacterium flavum TaxID=1382802 RepID=A0ABW4RZP8_9RHOB
MCTACGFPARPGIWTEAGLEGPGDRMRARFRRAQILREVLRGQGLTAHDDGQTAGVQIARLSGGAQIVGAVPEIWPAVEAMLGRPFDPLDLAGTEGG